MVTPTDLLTDSKVRTLHFSIIDSGCLASLTAELPRNRRIFAYVNVYIVPSIKQTISY